MQRIQPDGVHLNLPTRTPVETWVNLAEGSFDLSKCDSVETAVIEIITRHPMRQEELERTLAAWVSEQIPTVLASLSANDQVQIIERLGTKFWSVSPSHYPDEPHSLTAKPKTYKP